MKNKYKKENKIDREIEKKNNNRHCTLLISLTQTTDIS